MAKEVYEFRLNGTRVTVDAEPDTPLVYVLRNQFGLKGTRFGCGEGLCGVCTVLLGDRDVASCGILMSQVAGAEITTVEGLLGPNGALGEVQQVIVNRSAGQCGFCLSGIVMRLEAGLREKHPSRSSLREKLAGNLCRCGAHTRILQAVDDLIAVREGG